MNREQRVEMLRAVTSSPAVSAAVSRYSPAGMAKRVVALERENAALALERDAALALAERRAGVITQLSAMMRGVEDALVRGEHGHTLTLINRAIIHAIAHTDGATKNTEQKGDTR